MLSGSRLMLIIRTSKIMRRRIGILTRGRVTLPNAAYALSRERLINLRTYMPQRRKRIVLTANMSRPILPIVMSCLITAGFHLMGGAMMFRTRIMC